MSKLAAQDKFLDLSDYGRPFGKFLANQLKNTRFTPIHVTLLFGLTGLIAIYCILNNHYFFAGFFILLKSKLRPKYLRKVRTINLNDVLVSVFSPSNLYSVPSFVYMGVV